MINRAVTPYLELLLEEFPAVGILGPRQVGKTTLAKQVARDLDAIYLDLELPEDLAKLSDVSLFLKSYQHQLVILDEIQVRQDIFPILRALIDQDRRPGRFLLLGSASPTLMRHTAESLAGRIAYLDLLPLHMSEIPDVDQDLHWLRGGFPMSYLARTEAASMRWRSNFIRTYVEKDLPLIGLPNNPNFIRRFWTMASHLNGKLSNYNQISRSLQVSAPTVREYYDLFVQTFLIHELPPYFRNIKKRIVKSPKYYLNDTGILHSHLGLKTREDLFGHPDVGLSWETYVIQQIRANIKDGYNLYFYKTHQGAEIDLVICKGDIPFISCEIKLTDAPRVSRGMKIAIEDVGTEHNFVITYGSDRYPLHEKIEAISVHDFVEVIRELG